MKKVTTLILAAAALALQACVADGTYSTYGTHHSSSVSGHYSAPSCMPLPRRDYHHQPTTYVYGPAYYRMERPVHGRVKNYMDAPIIAPTCNGGNVIIPRSWD